MMLMCLGLGEVQMEEGQRPAKRTHHPPPPPKGHPSKRRHHKPEFFIPNFTTSQIVPVLLKNSRQFYFLKLHPSKLAAK